MDISDNDNIILTFLPRAAEFQDVAFIDFLAVLVIEAGELADCFGVNGTPFHSVAFTGIRYVVSDIDDLLYLPV